MKKASYRTWVLLIGIAVAAVICIAALVVGAASASSFSMTKKPAPNEAPSVVAKKVITTIATFNWKLFTGK